MKQNLFTLKCTVCGMYNLLQYKYILLYLDRKTEGTFISYQQSFAVFCIQAQCAIQASLCNKKLSLNDTLNSLQGCTDRETTKGRN